MRNLLKGIWAGIMIAIGCEVFLMCNDKTVGSFLFSIGLMSVLVFGFNLYTGEVCDWQNYKKPLSLLTTWVYNLLGAVGLGLLLSGHSAMAESARLLVDAKLAKPWGVVYIDALLCGVFIGIAVHGYRKFAGGSGGLLAVVLGVMGFILSGSEHVIADMAYIAIAQSGELSKNLLFVLMVTLGNTVGGAAFGLSLAAINKLERVKNE